MSLIILLLDLIRSIRMILFCLNIEFDLLHCVLSLRSDSRQSSDSFLERRMDNQEPNAHPFVDHSKSEDHVIVNFGRAQRISTFRLL